MKRNWDLLRYIMTKIESAEADQMFYFPKSAYPIPPEIAIYYDIENLGQDNLNKEILESVLLLGDEKLIDMVPPVRNAAGSIGMVIVYRLTNSGHNFIDLSRDDNQWKDAKQKIVKSGGAATITILTQLLIAGAKQQLGLS